MHRYNKFMTNLWLIITIVILIVVTYFSLTEGFNRWYYYYIFAGITLIMFLVRRWMVKRMNKHLAYLDSEQHETDRANNSKA